MTSGFSLPRRVSNGIAVAIAALALAGCGTGDEAQAWVREGVVFEDETLNNPAVVANDDGSLRAYLMQGDGIVSAVSSDQGRTWQLEPGRRVDGSHAAAIKLDDDRVRLYYVERPPPAPVVSAISDDGLTFTAEPGSRLAPGGPGDPDGGGFAHLNVVALPDGGFRLYYDATSPSAGPNNPGWVGIMSATSENGLDWSRDQGFRLEVGGAGGLRDVGMIWSPFVEVVGDEFHLYVSAETDQDPASRAGVYRARSSDGLAFKAEPRPILGLAPEVAERQPGPGGMPGLPQDVVLIRADDTVRILFWQVGMGTFSARLDG